MLIVTIDSQAKLPTTDRLVRESHQSIWNHFQTAVMDTTTSYTEMYIELFIQHKTPLVQEQVTLTHLIIVVGLPE